MNKPVSLPIAKTAVLTLAEIKAAVEEFDRGESNVFDVLDGIIVAVEAYKVSLRPCQKQTQTRRDAA